MQRSNLGLLHCRRILYCLSLHISILPQTPLPSIQQTTFFIHLRELNFHSEKIFVAMLPNQSNACYTCFMCSCNLCVFIERPEGRPGDKLMILRPLKALDLFLYYLPYKSDYIKLKLNAMLWGIYDISLKELLSIL